MIARFAKVRGILERWSEPRSGGASSLEKNRRFLVAAYALSLGVIGPTSGVCYWLLGAPWLGAWSIILGIVCLACLWGIRRGFATATAARIMTSTFWCAFAFVMWGGGGTQSPVTALIILIPITAGLLGGVSSAIRWGIFSVALVLVLGATEILGGLPEPFVLARHNTPAMRATLVTFLLLLMLGVALVQDLIHTQSRREADEARVVAETANELKTYFLLNISHELLTPLNGVLGLTELLEDTKLDDEQVELLSGVRKSGKRLHLLIEDLLDFAELQSGHARPTSERFDVQELAEGVVAGHQSAADVKRLRVDCDLGPEPVTLYGDRKRLFRCLSILVDNAIKFTDRGRILIRFECDGNIARWSVEDTGKGIPTDARSRIFDGFRQLEGGPTRRAGGLGLGLAHFVALVELLEGSFGLTSIEGSGSTFWFEVPVRRAESSSGKLPTAQLERGGRAGRSPRVLVAEDDAISRATVSRLLKRMNCDVVSVIHGRNALEALAQGSFDLVLMDCEMPVMDGCETTRRLRKEYSKDALPVVAVTAHRSSATRTRCMEAGMNDFVTKPISRAQLCRVLESWVHIDELAANDSGKTTGDVDARESALQLLE